LINEERDLVLTQRKEGVIVPPMSEDAIAGAARVLRRVLGLEQVRRLPIEMVYEMLWLFDDDARFEVVEDSLLGSDEARTYPDRSLILLRESVYDGAAHGECRSRFTMCHELGHLGLHRGVSFARIDPAAPPKIYENSEWQADVFASHLLMPTHLIQGYTCVEAVMGDFGVSRAAAITRLTKMRKGAMKQAS
jgi:hypothetical protein